MSQSDAVTSGGCTPCAGGSNGSTMYLTSFTTLLAPTNASITGAQISDLVSYDQTVSGVRSPCLSASGKHVAFGFRNTDTRIRVTNTTPRTIAFVQNVLVGSSIPALFADDVTTHMMVSKDTACADLAPVMLAWSERPELDVQGVNMGPTLDGIYGGENDSGNTAIQATVGDIPIQLAGSTPVPAGAAVWISFGVQPIANPIVTHNGIPSMPAGEWYRVQRVPSTSQLIFWFRDPIVAGTVITIRPN